MPILKLKPSFKDYIWGGDRLIHEYHKPFDGSRLAESWELSCHPDGLSTIAEGPYAGQTLLSYLQEQGWHLLGNNCAELPEFPILVKLIDAKKSLSVQVHPDDEYAYTHEGEQGKTEMWYIIDCEDEAFIYRGVERQTNKQEIRTAVEQESLTQLLHKVPVAPGEAYLIEAGTVHAIGEGILLAEVQQSSNQTYRLYDFGRKGADGKPRELHLDKALDVMQYTPSMPKPNEQGHLAQSDYFVVDKVTLEGHMADYVGPNSFTALMMLRGSGMVADKDTTYTFHSADTFFLPADDGFYHVEGRGEFLSVTIPQSQGMERLREYQSAVAARS